MHLRDLYNYGIENMKRYSIENPALETSVLLSKTGVIRNIAEIYTSPEKEPDREKVREFYGLLERRLKREPIAYIVGEKEFYSRSFIVDRNVLIPRPETELLVEEALKATEGIPRPVILDIGTGSGCVAVTMACELGDCEIYATDISPGALAAAQKNAERHLSEKRILLINGHLSDPFSKEAFDIVVSNPPYIPEEEYRYLDPDVKDYEPRASLIAGEDGLYFIRGIISGASYTLKNGGWCLLEAGAGQASTVKEIFEEHGFREISSVKDIAGIERVVKAQWKK